MGHGAESGCSGRRTNAGSSTHHPRTEKRSGPPFAPHEQEIRSNKFSKLAAAPPRWQVSKSAQDLIPDQCSSLAVTRVRELFAPDEQEIRSNKISKLAAASPR